MAIAVNEADRKVLKGMIEEMVVCLERIEAQKEQMKDIAESAEDKFEIKKKYINKMARTMFKSSYRDLQSENEAFEQVQEAIVGGVDTED